MKIIDGAWSLVTAGKWNRYILNPGWIGKNLFNEEEVKVEFPVNNPDLPPRYTTSDNIIFVPATHRTNFIAQSPYSNEMLIKICKMNRKLMEILLHTPITAIGANFGFEEKSEKFRYLDLFKFSDSNTLADNDYIANISNLKRQFELEKGLLNFTISYNEETVKFDFNFHYQVSGTDEALQILQDDTLITNRDIALKISKEFYDLEIDEEEEEQNEK